MSSILTTVKNFYTDDGLFRKIVDGQLEYPSADAKNTGAEIEFRHVHSVIFLANLEELTCSEQRSGVLLSR